MFSKPKCKRCNQKLSKKYVYCPFCGLNQKENSTELFKPAFDDAFPFPFNMITNKLVKDLEKELSKMDMSDKEGGLGGLFGADMFGPQGISINIDTSSGQPTIRINAGNKNPEEKPKKTGITRIGNISNEKLEKLANLPKEEPSTKMRRLANKLVYEITLPGVKNENIVISKLENSIEIKAFSDNKAFFKLIPMALPIMKSDLKDGMLTLELKI